MSTVQKGGEHESEILMASYRNLNEFLCAFINHALPIYNYVVRRRFLMEKIFNCEFQRPKSSVLHGDTDSVFYIGKFNRSAI